MALKTMITRSTFPTRSGKAEQAFVDWTNGAAFRKAHKNAGQNKPLYIGGPQFEGFEVIQTVGR